jgi:Mrp family chromosome partitioning ATPase
MDREATRRRIRQVLVVLSGKGGVGKSTVAVNLATALAMAGRQVGLLDVDLHGPSVPTMLNLTDTRLDIEDGKLVPAMAHGVKVISIGFLLEHPDNPVIWRGPAKAGVIKQLVEEVAWGDLDYLVVDCPPGTGDEPLSIIQTLGDIDGAIIVTTPQDVALADVRKSISFCDAVTVPVLGVIENMSGLVCPHCGELIHVFKSGGGEQMADDMEVPFLGRLPMDPQVVTAGDAGTPFVQAYTQTAVSEAMSQIVQQVLQACETTDDQQSQLGRVHTKY